MIKKNKNTNFDKIISKRKSLTASGKGKAAIWTRVSSEEQFKSNSSIDTQLSACYQYCEQHNKEVKCEFGGTFESAKKAGEKFLDMVGCVLNDPEIDTIVVFDIDRFSRNLEEGLTYKSQLNKSGVCLTSVNQPIDQNNLLAKHIEAILLIVADIDNAMRRHKCQEGMIACINRGEWYSKPPLGYTSKKVNREHRLTINEDGRILKNAWEWIANEPSITQSRIIERLKARGLTITKQHLSACLRNCFYCGRLEHKYLEGRVIKGKQEQLISEALFDKVQQILDGNNNAGYEVAAETPQYPLKGHVYYNGHLMTGYPVKKKNKDHYNHYYKYSGKDGSVNVSAKELHAKYIELLNQFKVPKELIPVLVEVIKAKFAEKEGMQATEQSNIKKNIATLQTQIKKTKRNYAIGKIDEDVYKDVIADLERDLHKVEGELERASVNLSNLATYIDDTIAFACNLSSYWQKMDFEMCQGIQKLVFPEGVKWDKESRSYRTINHNSFFEILYCVSDSYNNRREKRGQILRLVLFSSGGRTRTSDLRVMSPTSCQLLYPAMYRQMVNRPIFLICECKDRAFFPYFQIFL